MTASEFAVSSSAALADPAPIRALISEVELRDGAPPLSDQATTHLQPVPPAIDTSPTDATPDVQHLLVGDPRTGRLLGYAQLDGDSLELAADAGTATATGAVIEALLDAAERARPGFHVWAHGQRSPIAPAAARRGYQRHRELYRLRRPAADVAAVPPPDGITLRAFVPGQDEIGWLAVNAAAFATHAEQGRWTIDDLRAREAEPWFDPAGFLLAEMSGASATAEIVGFHWTKIHPDGNGEVYVLGVSPGVQGMGLGPALLAAGLQVLAGRDVLLYVDGSNERARNLYRKSGFVDDEVDIQFTYHPSR
ncbi:MAG TPA: mycothiol synthase [Jatrophihabitantaceae bacterium]|jgi:mycothiol synthase|nr:mycothiol synthase [Jatrophihabitantaceae bacterium]